MNSWLLRITSDSLEDDIVAHGDEFFESVMDDTDSAEAIQRKCKLERLITTIGQGRSTLMMMMMMM